MYETISVPRKVEEQDLTEGLGPFGAPLPATAAEGRERLELEGQALAGAYARGCEIGFLLRRRALWMDSLLAGLFSRFGLDQYDYLSLIAVGGYGRAELFPHSDIDLLLTSGLDHLSPECQASISGFMSFLWDLHLDLGSSVRSIRQTMLQCRDDVATRTNLVETRLITGSPQVYKELLEALRADQHWGERRFLSEKVAEQEERHHHFEDTTFRLEPDVKNNPGGLRDLQALRWLEGFRAQMRGPAAPPLGVFTPQEAGELRECQRFLFEVRYALHSVISRPDDRLTLDRQKGVAQLLGYGTDGNRPVERMMRSFFRILGRVHELSGMGLKLHAQAITGHLVGDDSQSFISVDFVQRGNLIDVMAMDAFSNPIKIMELFLVIAQRGNITGLHINCLRALREARRNLKSYLCVIPDCRRIFKTLLLTPGALATALPLMHQCRILSAYMPEWEHIEGLMQFDMFHCYTVDEHTIRVMLNINALQSSEGSGLSLFRSVSSQVAEPLALSTAALLHDLGKGGGGHHAEEGAKLALDFCRTHNYTEHQIRLISWLVRNHLQMSAFAQRRDTSSPEVIGEFADLVEDEEHLNLLYCLTVADINGTNEREWTTWKDSLLRQFYLATRQALRQGPEKARDLVLHAEENRGLALRQLPEAARAEGARVLEIFPATYLVHFTPQDIAWHLGAILAAQGRDEPLVLFAQRPGIGTEVMIWMHWRPYFLANAALVMASKRLDVNSARIHHTRDRHTLCSIIIHTRRGEPLDPERFSALRKSLMGCFGQIPTLSMLPAATGRRASLFRIPTSISYLGENRGRFTDLEISTLDSPGLLARICIALANGGCLIRSARITTTGERADDYFTVTDTDGRRLGQQQRAKVISELQAVLESAPGNGADQGDGDQGQEP
ncbi:MAG: [protein-PII] uridylyltransferase [Succinivibrionaceae bacterium]|nr:[protein-PII] uridylyltransferase [Succinivibrionaceae bacterium]